MGAPPSPGRVPVVIAALLAVLAGCGLRADERPQPIPRERLDERLFQEGTDAPLGSRSAYIYVLSTTERTPRLVRVPVRVPSNQDDARAVLETLLNWAPPADHGGSPRLSSIIPYGTTLRDARRDGDVLNVDLGHLNIEGSGQTQAVAQIVYTATELPGVKSVRISVDGKPVSVPLDDRSTAPGERLDRSTVPAALRPEPTPTTTRPRTSSSGPEGTVPS